MSELLREILDEPVAQAELDEVYHRLEGSLQGRPSRRWLAPLAFGAVASIVLVVVGLWPDQLGPIQIAETGTELRHLNADSRPTILSDGSSIALAEGTRISAVENTAVRVELLLSPGRADFDIQPEGPRAWTIDAGEFAVDVLGTRFIIERSATHGLVSVERGQVRVRGSRVDGGFQILGARETLRIELGPPPARPLIEVSPVPQRQEQPAEPETPIELDPAIEDPSSWRQLAERGAYREAYERVEPVFESELARAQSVEVLFVLADTARLSGHPALARDPLERIVAEYSLDGRAGVAAFTLGKIESETRPNVARRWFDRALELGLSPSLARAAQRRRAAIE